MKIYIIFFLSLNIYANDFFQKRVDLYSSRNEVVERYYKRYENFVFVHVKIRDLKSKKIKKITFNYISTFQTHDDNRDCLKPIYDSLVMKKEALDSFSKLAAFDDRFYKTKYGVLVEKSCIEKTSKEYMEKNILNSYRHGVQCLEKLGTKASVELLSDLGELFKNRSRPPKIFCNESDLQISMKGIKWDSAKAYASPNSSFDTLEMKHPFVSFSPKGNWRRDSHGFQGTLFHELFHNTGNVHTETIERPYSCQSCCFNTIDDPNLFMSVADQAIVAKKAACKVCGSSYEGITDQKYLKDFTDFRIADGRTERLFPVLKVYMKEGPKDNFAIKEFSRADRASSNMVAEHLDTLISGNDLEVKDDISKFAKGLYHFSRGEYRESAEMIKQVNSWSPALKGSLYKGIYEDIQKDLFFISLTDDSFNMKTSSDPFSDGFFKKAAKDFSLTK
ncbi:MAG: hypothetical protein BM556_14820 [Bacteriovorax sp. MedPE-SWde]|nr:MAG: hypothetical protein BM556_14820 [Bacteriovorax sp. MedPE-SWde]